MEGEVKVRDRVKVKEVRRCEQTMGQGNESGCLGGGGGGGEMIW